MKKYILMLLLVALAAANAVGQNANRSGVFVEAGIGVMAGKTPISKYVIEDAVLYANRVGGASFNVDLGYRLATSRSVAVELKAQFIAPINNISSWDLHIMPGIRYTTRELLGNISMFFSANVGFAAICSACDYRDFRFESYTGSEEVYNNSSEPYSGIGYSLSIGLNFTQSLYGCVCWDGDNILSDYEYPVNFGSLGVRLGYRF